ncbi:MAG: hypothetical protein HW387_1227 [Parachlamydiales bacterium]|nr:hypothetical protein [Parachlamydiales bacterium]
MSIMVVLTTGGTVKKIVVVSGALKWAAIAFIVIMPILEAGYWITNGYPFLAPFLHISSLPAFGDIPIGWADLTEVQKLLGFIANLLPLFFSMAALGYLARLFSAYEHLRLFERKNADLLKKTGGLIVLGQVAHLFYTACISLVLTCRNPVGHRNISISIGLHELEMLAIGIVVLLVSWIYAEAIKMHEEQEATV